METNKVPKISGFAKYFTIAMALVPIAIAIWLITIVPAQDAQGRYLVLVIIVALVFLSSFLAPYMIRVSTTQFSVEGVEQVALFKGGRFWLTASLKWQSVEKVSYKQLAYKLFGDNEVISIYLGCFGDYKEVADFINGKLPKSAVWG